MPPRLQHVLPASLLAASLAPIPLAHAEVWGLKSHDPLSNPPTTLYHFAEDGLGPFVTLGTV